MNLNKATKKIFAYICSLTMIVACMAGYQTDVSAAVPDGYTLLDTEKWHPLGETVDTIIGDDNQPASVWNVYTGNSWSGVSAAVKDGADDQDTVSIYVETAANNEWGLQLGRVFKGLEPGKSYAYQINYTIDNAAAKWIGIANADANGELKVIKALGSVLGAEKTFTVTSTEVFDPSTTELTQYLSWLTTSRNLAYQKTASVSSHKEGQGAEVLTDGIWDKWNGNYEGINTPGYIEVDLGQEYAASSIDQVVVWFRNGSANLYPSSGYDIQFGNLVFKTAAEVTSYPVGADDSQADGSQYMVATTIDKENVSGNVRKVRIQVDQNVPWGAQVTEVAVFAENPQDPIEIPPADDAAGVTVSSEQTTTLTGELKFNIKAGEGQEDYTYAVFLDDAASASMTGCLAGKDYTITGVTPGTHKIKVVSCYNDGISPGIVSDEVVVKTIIDDVKDYSKNFAYKDSWELMGGSSAEGSGSITNGTISGDEYATPTKDTEGSYFIIDLGVECNVADIDSIYTWYRTDVGGCYPGSEGMLIEYSTDKETWATAATISQSQFDTQRNAQNGAPFNIVADVSSVEDGTVRYVKVSCPAAVGYGMQVTEIAIFGTVPEDQIPVAPDTPTGLVNVPGADNATPYKFVWDAVEGATYYNVYVNDGLVGTCKNPTFNAYGYFVSAASGKYNVSVSAVDGKTQLESGKATIDFEPVAPKVFISADGNYMVNAAWDLYVGDWLWCDGVLSQEDGTVIGDFVTTGGGWIGAIWGISATSAKVLVDVGKTYTYTANINATKDMIITVQVAGNEETIEVKAGETYAYSTDVTPSASEIEVLYAMGGRENAIATDVEFTISDHRLVAKEVEETTTEAPTTNNSTTVKPGGEVTTQDPALMSNPGKVKIKKATKKASAKKVSIKIRKVKGASGYEVAVYKTKKNAKKNKKAIATTDATKIKIAVKAKNLKKAKKLFVRVRAYVKVGDNKITGKWSSVKKVNIKK